MLGERREADQVREQDAHQGVARKPGGGRARTRGLAYRRPALAAEAVLGFELGAARPHTAARARPRTACRSAYQVGSPCRTPGNSSGDPTLCRPLGAGLPPRSHIGWQRHGAKSHRRLVRRLPIRAWLTATCGCCSARWSPRPRAAGPTTSRCWRSCSTGPTPWPGSARPGSARFLPALVFSAYGGRDRRAHRADPADGQLGHRCALCSRSALAIDRGRERAGGARDRPRGPDLVREHRLQPGGRRRRSRRSSTRTSSSRPTRSTARSRTWSWSSGPAIGALLLLIGSPALAFAVNAASFAVSAVVVSRISVRSRPVDVTEEGTAGPLRQMSVGVRTIVSLRAARTLVAFSVLVSFVYGTDTVLFVGVSCSEARHRHRGVRLPARRPRGRRHPDGCGRRPTGRLAVARADHPRRRGGLLPANRAADRDPQPGARVPAPGRARRVDARRRRARGHRAAALGSVRAARARVRGVLRVRARGDLARHPAHADRRQRLRPRHRAAGDGDRRRSRWACSAIPRCWRSIARAPGAPTCSRRGSPCSRQLGIFATATRPILERLAGVATEVEFAPGTAIVREGDPADALYVLVEGEVEVTARGEAGGPEQRIRTMTAPVLLRRDRRARADPAHRHRHRTRRVPVRADRGRRAARRADHRATLLVADGERAQPAGADPPVTVRHVQR